MDDILNVLEDIRDLLNDMNYNIDDLKNQISEIKGSGLYNSITDVCTKLDSIDINTF